ncbi:cilia- and flagella-associated protein 70 isoform X1 [Gallus gallus]|uniref:cilia- and flagella-associated protein 70 isoform X1 n=1 Tax=Gallus gallus TaxID=9031 RepID=UPI001F014773|nr:cilia- and flagella-associated protein 70 isoform X1 [Gallus gallus]XP_046756695.1 cilia- and flagella-associated protein 70 isoform X1 [Gallus gallus]XP_046756696.1 cilia- and flagella-associated protein 70 isoform X1 [Gallus gallus]
MEGPSATKEFCPPDTSESQLSLRNVVQITVVKAQDLKSIKSDTSITLVRVEYNGVILGDSSKADVSPNGMANYNFTTSFEYSTDGPNSWVDIAQKPALLTVIEVLQKEKKQKEEKTMPLGQAVLDLLPLLQGQCSFTVLAPLYAASTSPSESLHPEAKCALEVSVCTKKPLLSSSQLSDGNFLSVTLEAAYSVPEAFVPTGPSQNYMACLQIPALGKKEVPLLFMNGILKLDGEKEPLPRPKKWSLANIMAPGALNIPNSFILGGPYEDEDGELNKTKDREFRIQAESMKRIVWDKERRCYLDPAAVLILKNRIAECQYWPVEVCRMPVTSSSKGKTSKADKGDEDRQIFFHGVAYVNMMPLLCPGVKRIRGAFRVFPYQDSEVLEKTKRQQSVLRDLRPQMGLIKEGSGTPGTNSSLSRAVPSKAQREDKEKMTREQEFNRRTSNTTKIQLSGVAEEAASVTSVSLDGKQYVEAGTFLVMEIKLDKALVPKRLQEELTRRVKEMIPPRPPLPPRTGGAKKAVEDYHNHVASIAVAILSEYHELFGKQLPDQGATDHQTLEEQRHQLNFELNSSGKYFAFKEQLKYAVVKIVREKYLKTTAFETQEQFQAFLSELYVYLVDQMHIALNQLLYEEAASPAPRIRMTDEQLWLFAREAEVNKDYKLASLYHQQRIAQDQHNIQYWLDYGAFCLLLEDTFKAQECFREALSLDPHHVRSLLLCGIVAVMLQHYEEAEIFFEDACCLEPSNVIAWTLSGLFCELQNNNIQAEMAFREAKKKLQVQQARERSISGQGKKQISATSVGSSSLGPEQPLPEGVPDGSAKELPEAGEELTLASVAQEEEAPASEAATEEPSPVSGHSKPPCTIFMKAVEFLTEVNAIQFVRMALAHELLSQQGGPSSAYYLALARTCLLKEEFSKCEECLCEAIRIDFLNPDVWAQKGHLCYLRRDLQEAKECYERTVSFVEDAADMHFVYLRLGSIYLEDKEYGKAKQIYLQACKSSASCLTWLGVGIACYRVSAQQAPRPSLKNTACIPGVRTVGGAITAAPFPAAHRCLPSPPRAHPFPSPLCCFAGRAAAGGRAVLQIRLEARLGRLGSTARASRRPAAPRLRRPVPLSAGRSRVVPTQCYYSHYC